VLTALDGAGDTAPKPGSPLAVETALDDLDKAILAGLVDGNRVSALPAKLKITPHNFRQRIERLQTESGARNTRQLAVAAVVLRWVPTPEWIRY